MDKIKAAIQYGLNDRINDMSNSIISALESKVSEAIQNKKVEIAQSMFGGDITEEQYTLDQGVMEGLNEMDKSAPQPGRDGKVSHSTYGSRDKEGSDYFKGKEAPGKQITTKQMNKDALNILKKQGLVENVPMAARTLYAQTYMKHAKTAAQSKDAKQKAYDAVEKKHGADVLAKLKDYHKSNMDEGQHMDERQLSKAEIVRSHTIGKEFEKKGVGDPKKGGPYAIATWMTKERPAAAKKAEKTIKSKK